MLSWSLFESSCRCISCCFTNSNIQFLKSTILYPWTSLCMYFAVNSNLRILRRQLLLIVLLWIRNLRIFHRQLLCRGKEEIHSEINRVNYLLTGVVQFNKYHRSRAVSVTSEVGLTTDRDLAEPLVLKKHDVFYTSAIPEVMWYEQLYNMVKKISGEISFPFILGVFQSIKKFYFPCNKLPSFSPFFPWTVSTKDLAC